MLHGYFQFYGSVQEFFLIPRLDPNVLYLKLETRINYLNTLTPNVYLKSFEESASVRVDAYPQSPNIW
ncbi:hypothetical protein QZH41_019176 [Actinostola sp. cb2023]|nr:hypothetical protein QZH41_019176 [Actinostola sp. cb2023]